MRKLLKPTSTSRKWSAVKLELGKKLIRKLIRFPLFSKEGRGEILKYETNYKIPLNPPLPKGENNVLTFIKLIAICNSVAMGMATELSDIDCFVVTTKNRLYTARFFLLLRAKLLRLSKNSKTSTDKLDFGFWVDETAMDLSEIAIKNDIYLKLWLTTLIPIFNVDDTFGKLIKSNQWAKKVYSIKYMVYRDKTRNEKQETKSVSSAINLRINGNNHQSSIINHQSKLELFLNSKLGDVIEFILYRLQKWRVWSDSAARHLKENDGTSVITSPHILKLHHFDQREKIKKRLRMTLEN